MLKGSNWLENKPVAMMVAAGTAGHINPALATAEVLQREGFDVVFLGSTGMEERLVPARGYRLLQIGKTAVGRRGAELLQNATLPKRLKEAVDKVRKYLRDNAVDVVVGFGGYVAAPAYLAAKAEGVPVVIHEQNVAPGLANKMGASIADYFAYSFPNTKFPKAARNKARLVGMPLLNAPTGRKCEMSFSETQKGEPKPKLLIMGGSLGALAINSALLEVAHELADAAEVIHITGKGKAAELQAATDRLRDYTVIEFCDSVPELLKQADLVISRAGASSVHEIALSGTPSVLVPYPVGNGEQLKNAELLTGGDGSGAVICLDKNFTAEFVRKIVMPLLRDNSKLAEMGSAARTRAIYKGAENLTTLVRKCAFRKIIRDLMPTHFMAISGTGVAPIAKCFQAVSRDKTDGCDQLTGGHSPEHLNGKRTMVYSSAIFPGNPERDKAQELSDQGKLNMLHRSDALKVVMNLHDDRVTVAGSHGKTTTTAMTASIFDAFNHSEASFAIGSPTIVNGTHTGGGQLGSSWDKPARTRFVAEADESDGTLVKYSTEIAIITNLEPDHLDFYGSYDKLLDVFCQHACNSRKVVTTPETAAELRELLKKGNYPNPPEILTAEPSDLDNLSEPIKLRVPGEYNRINAALARRAALEVGVSEEAIKAALKGFGGAEKRFEVFKFNFRGTDFDIVDDYAHHPTEVKNLMDAAREVYPDHNIVAVFRAHLYSRVKEFQTEFAEQLARADCGIVTKIRPDREFQEWYPDITPRTVTQHNANLIPTEELEEAAAVAIEKGFELMSENGRPFVIFSIGSGSSIVPLFKEYIDGASARVS